MSERNKKDRLLLLRRSRVVYEIDIEKESCE